MLNKKSHLGKKGNVLYISIFALIFSVISIIYIFISVFLFAVANDYLIYEMQNLTETLENDGIIKGGYSSLTQTWGDEFTNFNLHLDDLWLIAYITFIASSLIISYKADRQNYFSFLGMLFYGLMFFLFILTFFSTITDWFKDEIMLKIIPTVSIVAPKFYFYLDNLGVFSALHLAACFVVNLLDFDFAKIFQKKKKEEAALKDGEVI